MIFFVNVLRALAACIITSNRVSIIAFLQWYVKRISRIYIPVFAVTLVLILLGYNKIVNCFDIIRLFIYPTQFAFISAIIVIYIPCYYILSTKCLKGRLLYVQALVGLAGLLVYFFVYDRSYYHIDSVHEPFILFLYMESMLMGAWFRINDRKFRNSHTPWHYCLLLISCLLYIVCKTVLSSGKISSRYQVANQVALLLVLLMVFRTFIGIDNKLQTP